MAYKCIVQLVYLKDWMGEMDNMMGSENKEKKRVIVCGTRFGQFYLEAITRNLNRFELVGILAKGSNRSKKCAERYNTKLFTDIKDIPTNVDFACVVVKSSVMGGEGTNIALDLLNRGISVLLEQPVHHKDIKECAKVANKNKLIFMVGNLYSNLDSIKNFISSARKLMATYSPNYIEVKFTTQVSYPLARYLVDLFPRARSLKIDEGIRNCGNLQLLTGCISGVPIIFLADNRLDPKNPDSCLSMFHQISIGFESGTMMLCETFGNTVWIPSLYIEDDKEAVGNFPFMDTVNLYDKTLSMVNRDFSNSYDELFKDIWVKAVCEDIYSIDKYLSNKNRVNYNSYVQRELFAANLWQQITEKLGYPSIKSNEKYKFIKIDELFNFRR
ncbi:Gfo/Idh/MocA family oxidoreductase [Haloimpatiens sp. FM7330]|uniref:Gfo/Idh/MocA family oxidoreductase n=1 Tax=Haloimpatiens sp. FM7330 TaxID=3298610 RepID=UPI00362C1BA2